MTPDALKPALVTGGTGFIGSHLVRKLLSEGVRVRVLVRPNSQHAHRLEGLDVERREGDLGDGDAVGRATEGVKTVYHVGGAISSADPDAIVTSNVKGTEFLASAAVEHDVERFVFVSDTEVYDLLAVDKGASITEEAPVQQRREQMSEYTYSKIQNEKELFAAHREHGLKLTVIRPGMVIGPMGQIFFPHLGYRYGDRFFLMVGKGNNILPLIYVENLVDGIYAAATTEAAVGQIYNLVDDLEVTVRDYLERLAEVTGSDAKIVSVPFALPYAAIGAYEMAAKFGLVGRGKTSRAQFRWKHTPMLLGNSKARQHLDWRSRISPQEGLTRAFRWFLEHGQERNGSYAT